MKYFIYQLGSFSLELFVKAAGIIEELFGFFFAQVRNVHFIHIFLFSSYINLIYRLSFFEL